MEAPAGDVPSDCVRVSCSPMGSGKGRRRCRDLEGGYDGGSRSVRCTPFNVILPLLTARRNGQTTKPTLCAKFDGWHFQSRRGEHWWCVGENSIQYLIACGATAAALAAPCRLLSLPFALQAAPPFHARLSKTEPRLPCVDDNDRFGSEIDFYVDDDSAHPTPIPRKGPQRRARPSSSICSALLVRFFPTSSNDHQDLRHGLRSAEYYFQPVRFAELMRSWTRAAKSYPPPTFRSRYLTMLNLASHLTSNHIGRVAGMIYRSRTAHPWSCLPPEVMPPDYVPLGGVDAAVDDVGPGDGAVAITAVLFDAMQAEAQNTTPTHVVAHHEYLIQRREKFASTFPDFSTPDARESYGSDNRDTDRPNPLPKVCLTQASGLFSVHHHGYVARKREFQSEGMELWRQMA